jgi:hypothetical protein
VSSFADDACEPSLFVDDALASEASSIDAW